MHPGGGYLERFRPSARGPPWHPSSCGRSKSTKGERTMPGVKGRSGGHNRKPMALRLIQGNPGRRPINKHEPKPPARMPQCPRHLDGEARAEWRRLAPQLFAAGLLTELDVAALSALCVTWALWSEAEQKLASESLTVTGRGGAVRPSPWIAIASRAQRDMQLLAAEFGMTPNSRQRIRVVAPAAPDPFDELLNS
jgi:P27 family predicted phage terminase small subunit